MYTHRIVGDHDWSILRQTSFEKLVLSACHPLYSATHRWVVYARLTGATSASPRRVDRTCGAAGADAALALPCTGDSPPRCRAPGGESLAGALSFPRREGPWEIC